MVSGFLCIDKPTGGTSRDAVNPIQRLVRPLRVGHAGTLDPLATGVLVVAIGAATRLVRFVQDQSKRYRGEFELGLTTDTDDITGRVVSQTDPAQISIDRLRSVLSEFVGTAKQVPPQFSAVHVKGRRAYDLARNGVALELAARTITISSIELLEFRRPRFVVDVACSGGTYIRSLGRDVGQRLGCGATLTALRRTAVGDFTLERAVPLDEIVRERLEGLLWPPETAVAHLPAVHLPPDQAMSIRRGQSLLNETVANGDVALFNAAGQLIGVAEAKDGRLQPRLVLARRASVKLREVFTSPFLIG